MNCTRAAEVLRGLEKNELVVTSEEIEELLGLGLAVETDPDDLAMMQWLQPIVLAHAHRAVDDPSAAESLAAALRHTEEELQKDWYRMKTSKEELADREASRITMRRALAHLNDPHVTATIRTIVERARSMAPGAPWVACHALGSEVYGITQRGWRVRRQLKIRLDRYGQMGLKSFLHAFDKNETKMRAFAAEIGQVAGGIGYVRKNREQVVIGLVKTGAPAPQAIAAYRAGLAAANNAPDVAVTCARNAATYGSPAHAAQKLAEAQLALRSMGFPGTPIAMGAAKSLLAFSPPASGAPRFREIFGRLQHMLGGQDVVYKLTARLMPASGTPAEVVTRAVTAATLLQQVPSRANPRNRDVRAASVALASMVKDENSLAALVTRYREIEYELVRAGVSTPAQAEADALECVACPGTPFEVVDTVSSLVGHLSQGRRGDRSDISVAVAFAKRFSL